MVNNAFILKFEGARETPEQVGEFLLKENDRAVASFSDNVNASDVEKLSNINENLVIIRNGTSLSIERRPLVDVNDTLFLKLWNTTARSYQFEFVPTNFAAVVAAWLNDAYLNISTPLSLTGPTRVDFDITSVAASADVNRFSVVFKANGVLPVQFTGIKASQKNTGILVEWNVATESNVNRYEVEKSANGLQFVKATEVAARVNNNGAANYNWFDANPFSGNNFYRIKVIDNGSTANIKYSAVVNLKLGTGGVEITVFPNPVKDRTVSIHFTNQPKGKYVVELFNAIGQKVLVKTIQHTGGSASERLQLSTAVAKGVYLLQVSNSDNNISLNQRLVVE